MIRFAKLPAFLIVCLLAVVVLIPSAAFAAQTVAPTAASIKVVNNAGTSDTVTVTDLNVGDVVKVYANPSTTTTIGTGTVPNGTSTVVISIAQLGTGAGTIYVTVTSNPHGESQRISKTYAAEPASPGLDGAQITVTNNPTGTTDTVHVENVNPGDQIRVYEGASNVMMGINTVSGGQTSVTVYVPQLNLTSSPGGAGVVHVTRKSGALGESVRTTKSYAAESATPFIESSDITITNNVTGIPDTIVVRNVQVSDIIKVYATKTEGTPLATTTATTSIATLSIDQLGNAGGSVFVSVTRGFMAESVRTSKSFAAESTSTLPQNKIDVINNNNGSSDLIIIDNLKPTDVIRVYANKTDPNPVAMTTANKNLVPPFRDWTLYTNTAITGNYGVTLTASGGGERSYYDLPILPLQNYAFQITNSNGGTVTVTTLTNTKTAITNKLTSTTSAPSATFTTESNAAYVRIELTSTAAGTYNWSNPQVELGSSVSTFEEQTTITTKNLLPPYSKWTSRHVNTSISSDYNLKLTASAAGQSSYVRVRVSPSTQYSFSASHNGQVTIASVSAAGGTLATHINAVSAQSGTFTTDANAAYVDFIVSNHASGDFLFTQPQLELGAVATSFEPYATPFVKGSVTIPQIGSAAGAVYITITSPGSLESKRVMRSFGAESPTNAPSANSIRILNNKVGTIDVITVLGLAPGDVVKVYSSKIINTTMATETSLSGNSFLSIQIPQLGIESGTVYVSITSVGKTESARTAKTYLAE